MRALKWANWWQLYTFAFVMCAVGTIFSYNGPLTSHAWHSWILERCPPNGNVRAPIIDVIRAFLAGGFALFAFSRLAIIPLGDLSRTDRALNWLPRLSGSAKTSAEHFDKTFVAKFYFEPLLLLGLLLLTILTISIARPIEFLTEYVHPKNAGMLALVTSLYTNYFGEITRPYLFPYSMYILGFWYLMALPILLALVRSIRFDLAMYLKLQDALEIRPAALQGVVSRNFVGIYERKCVTAFAFIQELGKRYLPLILVVVLLYYIQQEALSCSVLSGAADEGKDVLLLPLLFSVVVICYAYLNLHYKIRSKALKGISEISDALQKDEKREEELREATQVSEMVRSKDGFSDLVKVGIGTGVAGIVAGLLWKIVFHENLCKAATAIIPTPLVESVYKLFQVCKQ